MKTRPKVLYLKRINESGPPCDCVSETYSEDATEYVRMAIVRKIINDIKLEIKELDSPISSSTILHEITTRLNTEII